MSLQGSRLTHTFPVFTYLADACVSALLRHLEYADTADRHYLCLFGNVGAIVRAKLYGLCVSAFHNADV